MGGVGGAAGAGGPSAAGNGSVRSPSAPRPWRLMVSTSPCLSLAGAPTGAWGARTPVPVSHPPGTGSPVGLLLTRRLEGRLGLLTRRLEGRLGLRALSEGLLRLCGAGIGAGCRSSPGGIGGIGGDGGDTARAQDRQEREDPGQELRAHVPESAGNNEAHGP